MIKFHWPVTFRKRQTITPSIASPLISGAFPSYRASKLPIVKKCLQIYIDFLTECELEPADHYLTKLLAKPNSFQTKENFFELLCNALFLEGNFFCRVMFDSSGRITKLLPYQFGGCRAYPTENDFSDALQIENTGYFYRDYRGRQLAPEQVWQIKNQSESQDLLNAPSMVVENRSSFDTALAIQQVELSLSQSHLKPPFLLGSLEGESADNYEKVRETIAKYFSSGGGAESGSVLSLPSGFELKKLMEDRPDSLLKYLSTKSDLEISKLFSVPIQMLSRPDGEVSEQSGTIREINRWFIKTTLESFLKKISNSLSLLAMDGTKFQFNVDRFIASDLREKSVFISNLVKQGVLDKAEAKKFI